MDKRVDRLTEFMNEYLRMELPSEKLERFLAVYDPVQPYLGCTKSHLEVLKIARERQYKNVLVFEDDFDFIVDRGTLDYSLKSFFDKNLDFKVLMLSFYSKGSIKYDELVSITTDAQTASGYIVNCNYFDELINCLEFGAKMLKETDAHWLYINDQVWKKLQGDKWFHFNNRIGVQRESYSDLSGCVVDYKL